MYHIKFKQTLREIKFCVSARGPKSQEDHHNEVDGKEKEALFIT